MRNTVTRLKPRSADYGSALAAFQIGDFSRCAESLSTNLALPAVALRARAFLRMNLFPEVLDALDAVRFEEISHEYAGELLALRAGALLAQKDPAAESVVTEARARAFSSGFKPVECEVEFLSAQAAFSVGQIKETQNSVDRLLEIGEEAPWFHAAQRTDYLFPIAFWRSRAYNMRGLIDALGGDYAAQARSIAEAFKEFDRSAVQDSVIENRMLSNLSALVRDLDSNALAAYVEGRADQIAWNEHTADAEFTVYHAIGWNHARRGDHLGAFRHLRRSANCAPTVPLQISAILSRSFLARELGEVLTAGEDLEHAVRLSKQVDWEKSAGSERNALFELASQLAPTDPKQARALWDRYANMKSGISSLLLAGRGDRRQRAMECSAHAAVLVAEGQRTRGISLLLESLEIWNDVGYNWRAASVSADLAELTSEDGFFEAASAEAEKQPNSWLARRLAAIRIPVTAQCLPGL